MECENDIYELARTLECMAIGLRKMRRYKRADRLERIAVELRDAVRVLFDNLKNIEFSEEYLARIISYYGWFTYVLNNALQEDDELAKKYSYLLDLIPKVVVNLFFASIRPLFWR